MSSSFKISARISNSRSAISAKVPASSPSSSSRSLSVSAPTPLSSASSTPLSIARFPIRIPNNSSSSGILNPTAPTLVRIPRSPNSTTGWPRTIFQDIALTSSIEALRWQASASEEIDIQNVTPNYFSMMDAKPSMGRISSPKRCRKIHRCRAQRHLLANKVPWRSEIHR